MRPKPSLIKVIASPSDFQPSSKDMKVIGAFNPAVTIVKKGNLEQTLLMIRIAETPKRNPKGKIRTPYVKIKNSNNSNLDIRFDEYSTSGLKKITHKSITFQSGLVRLRHISYPIICLSSDGTEIVWKEKTPKFHPQWEHERFGMEDPRIVKIEEDYIISYVIPHRDMGVNTAIAITKDFKNFQRLPHGNTPKGILNGKDFIPFPEKSPSTHAKDELGNPRNDYIAFVRPNSFPTISQPGISIMYSPDLIYWGLEHDIIKSKKGIVGPGPTPVKLKHNKQQIWFGVYHENLSKPPKRNYVAKLFALKYEKPWEVLATSDTLFEPNEIPEIAGKGYIQNVAYPSGLIIKGEETYIYSGENDTYTSVRIYQTSDILKFLFKE